MTRAGKTEPIQFESTLVREHDYIGRSDDDQSALIINPEANVQTLVGAAKARAQAAFDGICSWMQADGAEGTTASMEDVLRPFYHLTDEVYWLLDAIENRLAAERKGGAA